MLRAYLSTTCCVAPQVRGAFFEMVCALCEFTPELAQAEAARLCPAVLLSIDDTDPVVLPPVWEAVLHVVSTIPVSLSCNNEIDCNTSVISRNPVKCSRVNRRSKRK